MILQFEKMGLQSVIYRSASHIVNRKQHHRIGYYGHIPNNQFEYDHRGDAALFLDEDFVQRRLRATQEAYEKYKDWADVHAGPAVMEIFGETPFTPENCPEAFALSESQQKLQVFCDNQIVQITNRYIKHPLEAVSVGDVVDVQVLTVDVARKRIGLTMKIKQEQDMQLS